MKTLVLDDKWQSTIVSHVVGVVEELTTILVSRIQVLGDRYADTVGVLKERIDSADSRVTDHLAAMGVRP